MSDERSLAVAQERFVSALVAGDELPAGFDARGSRAMSGILLGKRRNSVRRAVPRIPQVIGAEFVARFDEFARGKPLAKNRTALGDAIAFLGWLRRRGTLPAELRFLATKLRWRRVVGR